ncbi:MAG: hypothetical protein EPO25_02730 [Gammaproteobacteria bacterium]|nr:MAG: hypothetical protein EPO25_02730 [Gammaproteobacteria bacterium]
MTILRTAALYAALAAGLLGLSGCANQQVPAEQALAGIEKSLEGSGEQLKKYLPERYEAIVAKVEGLRSSLAQSEYRKVVKEAPAVVEELRRAVADAAISRAEARIAVEAEWNDLIKVVPGMITAADERLAKLAGRPPEGTDREAFQQVVARYQEARTAWGEAASSIETSTFEATVANSRNLKAVFAETLAALGVPAS